MALRGDSKTTWKKEAMRSLTWIELITRQESRRLADKSSFSVCLCYSFWHKALESLRCLGDIESAVSCSI